MVQDAISTKSEARSRSRRRVLWCGGISNRDGTQFKKCQIKDISADGARIRLLEHHYLLPETVFYDFKTRVAYMALIVWKRPPEFGLAFSQMHGFENLPCAKLRRNIALEC